MKRASLFVASLLLLGVVWGLRPAYKEIDYLPDSTLSRLTEREKRGLGNLTSLALTVQFYLYGEKHYPDSLEALVNSVYFPFDRKEFYNSFQMRDARFLGGSVLGQPEPGDYVFEVQFQGSYAAATYFPDDSNLPRRVEVSVYDLTTDAIKKDEFPPGPPKPYQPYFLRHNLKEIKALSEKDQRALWACELLNYAAQEASFQAFKVLKPSDGGVFSHEDLDSLSWLMNVRVRNPYTGKPMAATSANQPQPGDFSVRAITWQFRLPSRRIASTTALPAFLCYGEKGKVVNSRFAQRLSEAVPVRR